MHHRQLLFSASTTILRLWVHIPKVYQAAASAPHDVPKTNFLFSTTRPTKASGFSRARTESLYMVKKCASVYFMKKKICGLMTFMPMSFERVGASTDIDSDFARCLRGYNFRGPEDTGRMRHFQVLYSTKVRNTKSRSKVPSFPRLLYLHRPPYAKV